LISLIEIHDGLMAIFKQPLGERYVASAEKEVDSTRQRGADFSGRTQAAEATVVEQSPLKPVIHKQVPASPPVKEQEQEDGNGVGSIRIE
jgi:hypothetical protein